MEEVASALHTYESVGPAGDGDNHRLRISAKCWATWCLNNTVGKRLEKGLAISRALAEYAALDDNKKESQ